MLENNGMVDLVCGKPMICFEIAEHTYASQIPGDSSHVALDSACGDGHCPSMILFTGSQVFLGCSYTHRKVGALSFKSQVFHSSFSYAAVWPLVSQQGLYTSTSRSVCESHVFFCIFVSH